MIPDEAEDGYYLSLNFWRNRDCPMKHGYTPATEDETARFRIGPLVIGWERVHS